MTQPRRRSHRKQPVTIKEVAEKAGVSQMTVSRVINRQGLVKEATREKVEQTISELHYRPNLMARRLAGGKSLFIGLVYHNPSQGYLSKLLVGALNACRDGGHHLVLEDLSSEDGELNPQAVIDRLRQSGLDGIILTPPISNNPDVIAALQKEGIAYVGIAPGATDPDGLRVEIDDAEAADSMTQYLIDQGHRRIGFVMGHKDHAASISRYNGFKLAMKRNNLEINPDHVETGAFTYYSGIEAGRKILTTKTPPTAIFASNDDMAAGMIAAARGFGFKVPKDISVVGFDDTDLATTFWPQLTTVRQPIAQMAEKSVDLLSSYIHNDDTTEIENRRLLEFSIVKRDSAIPPS
ncbi:MAG: transcriptional regulator [Robiginitomaculum sp.]|nr:MAG: transcriptional regulator [Robiginitomaculum sp.]